MFISTQLVDDDDIRTIRGRLMREIIWPVKENLSSVAADAVTLTHTSNSSCYWPDVDYRDKNISYRADWWRQDFGTGTNLVWMLQIQLYRSLATNNFTGVEQAFPRLSNDVQTVPLSGQGVQHDLSYHFHGLLLLSGTYGQEWAVAVL